MEDNPSDPLSKPACSPVRYRSAAFFLGGIALVTAASAFLFNGFQSSLVEPRTNILLITMDTTRADRLGCYGADAASTPTVDSLAKEGTLFEAAFSQIPITLPSHACLMTGQYPAELGVMDNGRAGIPEDVDTLASLFRRSGYNTAAFVAASVLDSRYGLDRGFDLYDDRMPAPAPGIIQVDQELRANVVCDRALTWLGEHADSPFFCWIHLFDPHGPYDPPQPYRSRHAHPYDGELEFTDSQLGRVFDWLQASGLREQTLVVVAGDHGEGLDDHGESSHGLLLYSSTTHVPLIFAMPGHIPESLRVAEPVGLVDIAPTICSLLNLELENETSGLSFDAVFRSIPLPDSLVYSRSDYARDHFGWSNLESVTTAKWRYINGPEPELYSRLDDPDESTNLAADKPDIAAELAEELSDLAESIEEREGVTVALSDDDINALKSLGYLSGSTNQTNVARLQHTRNPADMVHVMEAYMQAMELAAAKRYEDAINTLRPTAVESPESFAIHGLLGSLLIEIGQLDEAELELRQAIRIDPHVADTHCDIGRVMTGQGRVADAVESFRRAIEVNPHSARAFNSLGTALQASGAFAEAQDVYVEAIELHPTDARLRNNLGKTLLARGKTNDAIESFRNALTIDPHYPIAQCNLGAALASQGKLEEAIDQYQSVLLYDPNNSQALNNLGVIMIDQNRWSDALELYDSILAVEPFSVPANFNRGLVLAELGRLEQAVENFRFVVHHAPDRLEGYDQLSSMLIQLGRNKEAAEVVKKGIVQLDSPDLLVSRLSQLAETPG